MSDGIYYGVCTRCAAKVTHSTVEERDDGAHHITDVMIFPKEYTDNTHGQRYPRRILCDGLITPCEHMTDVWSLWAEYWDDRLKTGKWPRYFRGRGGSIHRDTISTT